jgi:hypothetical protein
MGGAIGCQGCWNPGRIADKSNLTGVFEKFVLTSSLINVVSSLGEPEMSGLEAG